MADINMFDLARRLIPNIEENMPPAVREAFEAGQVKEIFRTAVGVRPGDIKRGSGITPGSFYFRLDDGRVTRYGRGEEGWMGDRASTSFIHTSTRDDPFHFDRSLFHEMGAEHVRPGDPISLLDDKKYSPDALVGKQLLEVKTSGKKITNIHGRGCYY